MDPVSFLLLFLIVVLGGVVAFLADRLGRKLGKKRLSLLGLRPRHTAEALTVAAGMVIPLFTILVLLGLSSGIREWVAIGVAGVDKLKNEQRELLNGNAELRQENGHLSRSVPKLKADAAGLALRIRDMKKSLDAAVLQRDQAKAERDRLNLQTNLLKVKVASLNGKVQTLNLDVRSGRIRLASVQHDLKTVQDSFETAKVSLAKIKQDYNTLEGQVRDQYEEDRRLRNDIEVLQAQKTDLENLLAKAKEDLDRYQQDLSNVKLDLEEKQQEVDRLIAQQTQLQADFNTSLYNTRFARLVTSAGAELSRISLNSRETPMAARSALQSLLADSSKTANGLGAKPSKPGENSAMLRDLPLANGKKITVDEQVAAIVKAVSNLPEESVLVAYSYWNVYEGESVPLQIRPFRNPIVYRAGELIAESRIDGSWPDDQIIGQIKDNLLMSVRQRAKKDRMIPTGSDDSFGAVSIEQLSALVRDLKAENRRVRLQAIAKNDTRAADPLQLSFKIKY